MKITMYDLLGMVKDGKAPKRICFLNHYYIWRENDEDYQKEDGLMLFGNIKINYILNSEVEILEEEKEIPEKLEYEVSDENGKLSINGCTFDFEQKLQIITTVNEIIDYLKSKGDE